MQQLFINTPEQLKDFCQHIEGSPWLAIDTEFLREKTYYPVFCLLQVSNGEHAACIDPLAIDDLSPILDILYRKDVIKVLHAAHQDLEIFLYLWETLPVPVFDTQLAAAITGFGDQMGYGKLVQQVLNVQLEKDQARTDWSHRPLDDAQQKYALNDVIYLAQIYPILNDKIKQLGRSNWLDNEYAAMADPMTYQVAPGEAWQRVKGRQILKGVQYAVLQKLADWRETTAINANRPRRWILKDEVMIDLARRMPQSIAQMKKIRGLEAGTIERHGQHFLELIQQGKELPKELWPSDQKPFKSLTRQQEALADLMMCSLRILADEAGITPAVIAGKKDLEKLIVDVDDTPLLQGWRRKIAGETLQQVAAGNLLPCWQNDQLVLCPRSD